jgi:hypothetical protein
VRTLGDLAQPWAEARGLKHPMIHIPLPGHIAHAFRHGYNTCPQQRYGRITWEDWFSRTYVR